MVIEERAHFSSWRVFLLVCNLPSILALLGLTFMPESPRFLLEAGREIEAMRVYQVSVTLWSQCRDTVRHGVSVRQCDVMVLGSVTSWCQCRVGVTSLCQCRASVRHGVSVGPLWHYGVGVGPV